VSTDLLRENRELRHRLRALADQATENDALLRRFAAKELDLLTAGSLPELLQRMVAGLARGFALDHVSLVLWDPEYALRQLFHACGCDSADIPGLSFIEDGSPLQELKRPWVGPLTSAHKALIGGALALESVALLPLRNQGCLLGVIACASRDSSRFTRAHATDFLQRLAAVGAVCLDGAINRERLVLIGLTDLLTGLPNRRQLEGRLRDELTRAARYGEPVSCLFLDMDHFKRINDTHGHAAGDHLLQAVAQRIREQLRASDLVARYGGEEFAVLLPHTCLGDAQLLAERIRAAVAAAPLHLGAERSAQATVSIGVAESRPNGLREDFAVMGEELLAAADAALYAAKNAGRDRVVVGAQM